MNSVLVLYQKVLPMSVKPIWISGITVWSRLRTLSFLMTCIWWRSRAGLRGPQGSCWWNSRFQAVHPPPDNQEVLWRSHDITKGINSKSATLAAVLSMLSHSVGKLHSSSYVQAVHRKISRECRWAGQCDPVQLICKRKLYICQKWCRSRQNWRWTVGDVCSSLVMAGGYPTLRTVRGVMPGRNWYPLAPVQTSCLCSGWALSTAHAALCCVLPRRGWNPPAPICTTVFALHNRLCWTTALAHILQRAQGYPSAPVWLWHKHLHFETCLTGLGRLGLRTQDHRLLTCTAVWCVRPCRPWDPLTSILASILQCSRRHSHRLVVGWIEAVTSDAAWSVAPGWAWNPLTPSGTAQVCIWTRIGIATAFRHVLLWGQWHPSAPAGLCEGRCQQSQDAHDALHGDRCNLSGATMRRIHSKCLSQQLQMF